MTHTERTKIPMNQKAEAYIDSVAPTPHWGDDDATMEGLIRARLCEAQRLLEWQNHRMRLAFEFEKGDKSEAAKLARAVMLTSTLGYLFSVVEADLLMEVQRLAPDTANEFARNHLTRGESGDYYPEVLWEWLVARGIDPEKVRAEARAEIAAEAGTR